MANEKKGRISNWIGKVKNSKRWFVKQNSNEYNNVMAKANEYTEKMKEPVTLESAQELNRLGEELQKVAKQYLDMKNPYSIEGRARYNYVKQISELAVFSEEFRDPGMIKKLESENKTLADLVDIERNQKAVDITNQEKKIYGAGASKRVRFSYEGKDGFFTPSENVGEVKVVETQNAKMKKENPKLWEKMCDNGMQYGNGIEDIVMPENSDLEMMGYFKGISSFTEDELKAIVNYYREITKTLTLVDNAKREAGIKTEEKNKMVEREFNRKDDDGKVVKEYVQMEVKDRELNGMSKRNTATSRVAGMLGMEDKVAKSKNIKIVDNGVETEGSFMETAKGIDTRSIEGRNKILSKGEIDLTAGSLQRDINRMQVLDMVCGQVDRHGGNFFYQVSDNPVNGRYQITGLQAIDNDMSFGNIKLDRANGKLPRLEELTIIDEEMLSSLNEFTPDKIRFILGEMLSEDEINAVISRRQEILNKARSRQLRVVKANEWGENTLDATKESLYYEQIKTEITGLAKKIEKINDNIVNEYDAAVERVKVYNEKNPDKKQPDPKKPEHYDEYKKDKEAREYQEKLKRRNEATKRLADMIGINNLAIDKKTLEEIRSKGEIDAKSERFQKDISKFQVFALLCGQENIYGEKIAYKSGEKLADGVRLQGIDEDMAFETFKVEGYEKTLKNLADLKVIDEEALSNCYHFFEKGKVEAMFGDLLSKEEMEALETRARAIVGKTRELENQTAIVKKGEWENQWAKEATKQNPYYKVMKENITEFAKEEYDEYENKLKETLEHNRKNRDDIKELPEKPEFYDDYKMQQFKEFDEKIEKMAKEGTLPKSLNDFPERPYGYNEYRTTMNEYKKFDEKIEKIAREGALPEEAKDLPERPLGYDVESKRAMNATQQATRQPVSLKDDLTKNSNELEAKSRKEGTKGIRPPLPPRPINNSKEPTRQPVSLKDDLAPKASNSKLAPKQPTKQAQKQNNGLGMSGK